MKGKKGNRFKEEEKKGVKPSQNKSSNNNNKNQDKSSMIETLKGRTVTQKGNNLAETKQIDD